MCKGPEVESTNAFIEQINVLAVQTYPSLYPSFFPRTLEGHRPISEYSQVQPFESDQQQLHTRRGHRQGPPGFLQGTLFSPSVKWV